MSWLIYYANPEVVLKVEDAHRFRYKFKNNCMDLVCAHMELVTLCIECDTALNTIEDHDILVEQRLADIT